jgi:hypothetical protein
MTCASVRPRPRPRGRGTHAWTGILYCDNYDSIKQYNLCEVDVRIRRGSELTEIRKSFCRVCINHCSIDVGQPRMSNLPVSVILHGEA